jgi:hypothetical protein
MTTHAGSKTISLILEPNKKANISDHFNEIKNLFSHEKQHVDDIKAGLNTSLGKAQMEQRAVKTQMSDPTYSKTRNSFQNFVIGYGQKYGLKF